MGHTARETKKGLPLSIRLTHGRYVYVDNGVVTAIQD